MTTNSTFCRCTSHTPGPWRCIARADWAHSQMVYVTANDWGVVAAVHVDPSLPHIVDGQKANLRLIAAAPDLLEALNDVVDFWERIDCTNDLYVKARAAIARATGETA